MMCFCFITVIKIKMFIMIIITSMCFFREILKSSFRRDNMGLGLSLNLVCPVLGVLFGF